MSPRLSFFLDLTESLVSPKHLFGLSITSTCEETITAAIDALAIPHLATLRVFSLSLKYPEYANYKESRSFLRTCGTHSFQRLHRISYLRPLFQDLEDVPKLCSFTLSSNWPEASQMLGVTIDTPEFPCHQLTHIDIRNLRTVGLHHIEEILARCPSAEKFFARVSSDYSRPTERGCDLFLPRLHEVRLYGKMPSEIRTTQIPWSQLRILYVGRMRRHHFFTILRQCEALEKFTSGLFAYEEDSDEELEDANVTDILLPQLTSLSIKFMIRSAPLKNHILDVLILPSLVTLEVYSMYDSKKRPFPLSQISTMIAQSGDQLQSIRLNSDTLGYDMKGLFGVLTRVPSVSVFQTNFSLKEDVLQDIGHGALLPHLEEIHCLTASLRGFRDLVRERVRQEEASVGQAVLRKAVGWVETLYVDADNDVSDLMSEMHAMREEKGRNFAYRFHSGHSASSIRL
ncbi:hypothetical protein H0H81_010224 [Sphagnurus paluster]|uniref:F-box domain-containing protein n=1 Tax=Sphagnurus paluster TaxID=117069 RepID=A0A9P7GM33_9AGAR|nr:hypothetical protein H0H81_010224 [Sphagnurus paluster]